MIKDIVTTREHLSKHDREIAAIRTLIRQGTRLLVETQRVQRRTETNLDRLERKIDAFIDSMRRGGGNGRVKGKLNIQ